MPFGLVYHELLEFIVVLVFGDKGELVPVELFRQNDTEHALRVDLKILSAAKKQAPFTFASRFDKRLNVGKRHEFNTVAVKHAYGLVLFHFLFSFRFCFLWEFLLFPYNAIIYLICEQILNFGFIFR